LRVNLRSLTILVTTRDKLFLRLMRSTEIDIQVARSFLDLVR